VSGIPSVEITRFGSGAAYDVRLREMLSTQDDFRRKIDAMEKRYDSRFQVVFEMIWQMLEKPVPAKMANGFHVNPTD